ncbi:hypothetical protein [Streptomyces xiamenensis]|uniref:hypothetical protein n=1 Tax=Streptomyces xiamenensis TaxID=408015 RepID=UPI0035D65621
MDTVDTDKDLFAHLRVRVKELAEAEQRHADLEKEFWEAITDALPDPPAPGRKLSGPDRGVQTEISAEFNFSTAWVRTRTKQVRASREEAGLPARSLSRESALQVARDLTEGSEDDRVIGAKKASPTDADRALCAALPRAAGIRLAKALRLRQIKSVQAQARGVTLPQAQREVQDAVWDVWEEIEHIAPAGMMLETRRGRQSPGAEVLSEIMKITGFKLRTIIAIRSRVADFRDAVPEVVAQLREGTMDHDGALKHLLQFTRWSPAA